MSGALMCAALLHIALFIALDHFAHFPDTSLSSNRGIVTRVHLTPPHVQPEPKSQTAYKIGSYHSQPKDQVVQDTSSNEPDAKETEQKSAVSTVETAQSSAHPAPNEQNAHTTKDTPQQNSTAQTKNEIVARDTSGDSPSKSIPNDSEINMEAARKAMEQPNHRRAADGLPPASNQEFTVYLQQLIEEKRRYPRAARRRNIEGSVEFSVHVSREGSLAELTLNSSSGSRILDKAAEDLLEKVFPVDYPLQENVRTTVRIIYELTEV